MERIARFEKVSREIFTEQMKSSFPYYDDAFLNDTYDSIELPGRATKGSAGYDIHSTVSFTLEPGKSILIPTGIRAYMEEGWMLAIFPRSGLGFKFRLQLNNTVGIIDSDYYNADNEGHIMCRITNDSREGKSVTIARGQAFVQGIFIPFGITVDDDADGLRTGGFGSTG